MEPIVEVVSRQGTTAGDIQRGHRGVEHLPHQHPLLPAHQAQVRRLQVQTRRGVRRGLYTVHMHQIFHFFHLIFLNTFIRLIKIEAFLKFHF